MPSFLDYFLGLSHQPPSSALTFPDPDDERAWRPYSGSRDYWGGFAGPTLTRSYVRPDDALSVSCVFAAVRIWCNVLGTVPVRFYRERSGSDGMDPVYNYPLQRVLSTDGRPNPWQSGVLWRMWCVAQQILWGLGLNEIKFDGASPQPYSGVPQLHPVESDHITQIDQLDSGRLRYQVSEPGKVKRILTQDQVLRVEGWGTHRLIPESVLRRSREMVAVWLAQQEFRSGYYARGASPSIIFEHPATMSDEALERWKSEVQGRVGGVENAHDALVLEEGMKARPFGTNAKDALLVDAWNAQVLEFARIFGVPAFMLDATSQLPYNSRYAAIREWIDVEVKARARTIEAAWKMDLIVEDGVVAEHDLSEILQGDVLEQQQSDCGYVVAGIKSPDEVRQRLGLNPLGGEFATPRRSANIGTDPGGDPRPTPRPGDQIGPPSPPNKENRKRKRNSGAASHRSEVITALLGGVEKMARAHASILVHRETDQVRRRAQQLAGKTAEWEMWLTTFYSQHTELIVERMAVPVERARAYADRHKREVLAGGILVCDGWDKEAVEEMVEMVMTEGDT